MVKLFRDHGEKSALPPARKAATRVYTPSRRVRNNPLKTCRRQNSDGPTTTHRPTGGSHVRAGAGESGRDAAQLSGPPGGLPASYALVVDGKRQFSCRESFLFTHLGFSGPVALDISRHYLKAQGQKQILANFIPDYDENSWGTYLQQVGQKNPRKTLRVVLIELLPQRLADIILKKSGIDASLIMNQLDKVSRQHLIDRCVHYPLDVTGVLGYSKAEVTAGGVDWEEINPKTLESKLIPGLYFAGEILDVDGRIGGFNFQWAWASGYSVAQALIKQRSLHEQKDH